MASNSSPLPTHAWGHGLVTLAGDGTVLDTWYPAPELGSPTSGATLSRPAELAVHAVPDARRGVTVEVTAEVIELAAPVRSTPDAYLRLHLL
ncbi:MAG: 2,3,4,5-tetrahydropyridine-2,6-dicarboxylate N-succinyltransferase, partial [Herbiconiux sp.]|nr:2,3,4,5-tetrahydropyridine-2,6-dicarboxylate N-succinyltransferase [Herbiconiux sp.]